MFPDYKIPELPIATALNGTEVTIIVQDGRSKQINVSLFAGASLPQTFITLNPEPSLANERALAVSSPLTLTDGGAGGNVSIGLNGQLLNFSNLTGQGVIVRKADNSLTVRNIAVSGAGLSVSNADGDAGNPTLSLADDTAALEALAGTGLAIRTGSNTWTLRQLQDTANQITITNPAGLAGNPTFAIASNPVLPGNGGVTLPSGTTGQRAGIAGTIRWNTTTSSFEGYNGSTWGSLGAGGGSGDVVGPASATDGAVVLYDGSTGKLIKQATGTGIVKIASGVLSTVASIDLSSSDASGTLAAGRFPALTGDVTTSAGSLTTAIGANKVLYSMVQQVAASRMLGNPTGSAANVSEVSLGTGLAFSGTSIIVSADTTNQQVRISKGGSLVGTRREVNLIEGTNVTMTVADDAGNNRVNVTINASGGGGSGDVVGPASATDNAVARFDGTTGKLIQNSSVTIDDSGNITGVTLNLTASTNQIILDSDAANTGTVTMAALSTSRTWTLPNATGTIVLTGNTATLQNKTLDNTNTVTILDTLFTLQDNGDNTKQLQFQLSGISTGTTAILTVNGNATLSGTNTGDQTITLTSDVTGSGTGSFATTIAANAVTDAKFRQSAALSVVGRSANSTGNVADIAAGSDHQVLRRSGTSIGFGAVDLSQANAITGDLPFANLAQGSARSVLGVTGNATADFASIQGTTDQVLRINGAGNALAFGAIDLSKSAAATGVIQAASFPALTGDVTTSAGALATTIANNAVTYAKMQDISATQRILGRNTAGAGDTEEVTITQALDWLSTTQGAIIYRNASAWVALAPGTSGQLLSSGGAGANPSWITASGTGTVTSVAVSASGSGISVSGSPITTSGTITLAAAGKDTIWIPAAGMYASTTSGAASAQIETATNKVNVKVLDFDAAADEYAHFSITMPKSWDEGTITFIPYWLTAGTSTGDCIWGLQGVAESNADALDTAYGTAQTSTDAGSGTANQVLIGPESSAITIAGSPAAGDIVHFRVYRDADAGGDTLTGDARLLGIKILFTFNTFDDT